MPRSGPQGTATPPPGVFPKNPGDIIPSSGWNQVLADLYAIANTPTPLAYGGTGATDAAGARTALGVASADQTSTPNNISMTATVAGNALTVSLKGIDGNNPSASNPVIIPFRSDTASSGDVDVVTITAATSLVISSGSTLGTANATAANLVVVVFNDSGTARMGVINPRSGQTIFDSTASSTAEGGAGAADSSGVFYTGTAVASKAYTVIGYIKVTQAVAGTWATDPSRVQTGQAAAVADDLLANSLPMFACRAFVNFSASGGTITIRRSGNVTSVVRNAIGDYTVTMTTAMPDINYTVMTSLSADLPSFWVGTVGMHSTQSAMTAPTTTVFRISVRDPGNSAADYPYISVSVFY